MEGACWQVACGGGGGSEEGARAGLCTLLERGEADGRRESENLSIPSRRGRAPEGGGVRASDFAKCWFKVKLARKLSGSLRLAVQE